MPYEYNVALAFSAVARRHARRPVLKPAHEEPTTYEELDSLSNRFAAIFRDRGIGRRDVIGIVHNKSRDCYAAMLAALKLGATYVNLDDQNPAARLAHILGTAQPKLIFGEEPSQNIRDAAMNARADIIDAVGDAFLRDVACAPVDEISEARLITGSDPAYIMYTSGSTGVPKGAMMTHANVLNFGAWAGTRFSIEATDVLTNVNPMYFDNSVFDFYGAILNGAALTPVARETLSDAAEVVRQVEEAACTIWFSVPSMLIYLTTMKLMRAERLPSIRAFVFGGEGYPKPELRKLHNAYGSRSRLVNVYGPTECTCICSAWDVRSEDLADDDGLVTLGPVAENFSMAVLDGNRPAEPGEVGELCLTGPQVGLGYVNDPERTAHAFTPSPLHSRWHERMYRTGDLVRLGADGRRLDFVGRKDNQIKHMGYRIELEEIESALNRIAGVTQSAVLQHTGKRGHKLIVAFVSMDRSATESELRAALESYLPPYMIPQRFSIRAALPKNANGKIDKIALAAEEP